MKRQRAIMLAAALAAALSVSPAHAERAAGPCRQDIQKLCPDAKPGGGAFRDCLKQHAAELSPECKARLNEMKGNAQAWRAACQNDAQQFCAQVQPGGGNIIRCLHQHHDQLSQSCQQQLAQARQRHRNRPAATPPTGTSTPQ